MPLIASLPPSRAESPPSSRIRGRLAAACRGAAMAGALAAMLAPLAASAAGPAESPAEHVSSRILAMRCGEVAQQLHPGETDPICHRTLAPGDSQRAAQRAERDRGLLAAYPDVATLMSMRDRQIDDIEAQVDLARRRMVALHRELESLRRRAQAVGGPRADEWMDQARVRAVAILAEEDLIRIRRAEQAQIRHRFERDARRLRVLLSANGIVASASDAQPRAERVAPAPAPRPRASHAAHEPQTGPLAKYR